MRLRQRRRSLSSAGHQLRIGEVQRSCFGPRVHGSASPELPYDHPSHAEVRIRLTARGVLLMERDRHLGDSIQPCGEEGGLLCFRCPEEEYGWLVRTLLGLGPDAEALAPESLRQLVRQAALDIVHRYAEA